MTSLPWQQHSKNKPEIARLSKTTIHPKLIHPGHEAAKIMRGFFGRFGR